MLYLFLGIQTPRRTLVPFPYIARMMAILAFQPEFRILILGVDETPH